MEALSGIDFVAVAAPAPAGASGGASFHDVLSAMNPLQYVPVVGSIYRALTGDAPPEPVRMIGSVIFSGLTGGPIGAVLDVAEIALEKLTGFDPDRIVHGLMASAGMLGGDASPATAQRAAMAYAQAEQVGGVGRG